MGLPDSPGGTAVGESLRCTIPPHPPTATPLDIHIVHPDYFAYDPGNVFRYSSKINRIVTVMTVLEAPDAGGATVFPFLGQAVFPQTGSAAVWFNVKPSGEPIPEVHHAACPILLGQKWSEFLLSLIY